MDNAIALQYKPTTELESPLNMMAKLSAIRGSQQENAMRQAQMENYRSEIEKRNAMLPFEQAKARSEQETARIAQDSAASKLVGERLDLARRRLEGVSADAPDADAQYIAWHKQNHRDPVLADYFSQIGVSEDDSLKGILSSIYNPDGSFNREGLRQKITESKLGVDATIKREDERNKPTAIALGGTTEGINARGETVWTRKETATPGEKLTDARLREKEIEDKGDPETTIFGAPVTDAAGNVRFFNKFGREINRGVGRGMGRPTATYEKTKAQQKQLSLDTDTTISELERATAKGGLIEKGTSSGIGALMDLGGQAVGYGTEGSVAIGALKPIYDMVLKMVPRFEGPQSDKDTASYAAAAGDFANPNIPTNRKMAAAKEILRLMKARKGQFLTRDMAEGGGAPAAGADHSTMTDAELLSALGGKQ